MNLGFGVALAAGPLMAALIAGVAWAAAHGRLPRNGTVGLRLPSMLRSDAAWRVGHHAAQTPAYWSLGLLTAADLVAVVLAVSGVSKAVLTVGLTALFVASITWITIASSRAARGAAS